MDLLTRCLNMRQAKSVWSRPSRPSKSARCWSWGRSSGLAFSGSGCVVGIDSLERPLYLLHDWRDGLYGIEELVPLLPVLDGVNVEALHLTEDVLHHYLEAVEASCLWNIDLYNHNVTNDDILNHSKFTFKHFPVFLVWLFWGWSPVLDTLW